MRSIIQFLLIPVVFYGVVRSCLAVSWLLASLDLSQPPLPCQF